jgi:hypothetical protein
MRDGVYCSRHQIQNHNNQEEQRELAIEPPLHFRSNDSESSANIRLSA